MYNVIHTMSFHLGSKIYPLDQKLLSQGYMLKFHLGLLNQRLFSIINYFILIMPYSRKSLSRICLKTRFRFTALYFEYFHL